jgi:hypothetical protein
MAFARSDIAFSDDRAARLISLAVELAPPMVPRSFITPFSQRKACRRPLAVSAQPTITPKSLIARASLLRPPRVPRLRFFPSAAQRTARMSPALFRLHPTMMPSTLTAVA